MLNSLCKHSNEKKDVEKMFSVTTFNIRFDDTSERKKSWELRKTLTNHYLINITANLDWK